MHIYIGLTDYEALYVGKRHNDITANVNPSDWFDNLVTARNAIITMGVTSFSNTTHKQVSRVLVNKKLKELGINLYDLEIFTAMLPIACWSHFETLVRKSKNLKQFPKQVCQLVYYET